MGTVTRPVSPVSCVSPSYLLRLIVTGSTQTPRTFRPHPTLHHYYLNDEHTGSKFEMDVATFGLDFLEECTTQGRTRSPSDGVPLFQGSFCSIIPWPIRWHEYDTLQMILGIFRHHGAHSCRLSGSNNLLMWLAQHGCLRTELNQFVANS